MTTELDILSSTALLFNRVRGDIVMGMANLHVIHEQKLWDNGNYSSFSEYVEQECKISKSTASKYLTVWEHYALKNAVSQETLKSATIETLYEARNLPFPIEKQLAWATTNTVREIKEQMAVKDGSEHDHMPISICKTCGKRL